MSLRLKIMVLVEHNWTPFIKSSCKISLFTDNSWFHLGGAALIAGAGIFWFLSRFTGMRNWPEKIVQV